MNLSKDKLFDYIQSFIYALVTFLFLYIFLWPVAIEGVSMEPTVYDGDRVFISRALCMAGFYDSGDIVMLKVNYDPDKKYIVKRIAAVPGDSVKIESGRIYVNGEAIEGIGVANMEIKLEAEQYFVFGDNRGQSYDSRDFGPLSKKDIVGKVILRWYPLKSMRAY